MNPDGHEKMRIAGPDVVWAWVGLIAVSAALFSIPFI